MTKPNQEVGAAWSQAEREKKESTNPQQVPAGDMLGSSDSEVARLRALAAGGQMPTEDETIGGPPQDDTDGATQPQPSEEIPDLPPEVPSQQDITPPEEAPHPATEEAEPEVDPALLELFSDDDVIPTDAEVEIGGRKYTGDQIRQWQEAANQSESLQREYADKERRLETAAQMMINDPKSALEATGSLNKLVNQLREDGLLQEQPAQRDEFQFQDDETEDGAGRNANAIQEAFRQQNKRLEELQSRLDQREQRTEQEEWMRWHQGRLDTLRGELESMVKDVPSLKGPMGTYLVENVFLKCREEINQAPPDPSGLKSWAKDRLKQEVQRSGLLNGARTTPPTPPTKGQVPAKAGETPADSPSKPWEDANMSDDDERRKASLAWLEYYASS
jgi:hypothetical protein